MACVTLYVASVYVNDPNNVSLVSSHAAANRSSVFHASLEKKLTFLEFQF